MKRFGPMTLLIVALTAYAAKTPDLRDFAWRQPLAVETGQPIQEIALPDTVYRHVLDAGLGDLRVFNAHGGVVPHGLCPAPAAAPAKTQFDTLMPFPLLPGSIPVPASGGRIEIRTAEGVGVSITGQGGIGASAQPQSGVNAQAPVVNGPVAYVFDLRTNKRPAQAITLNWQSANQASEATVRIKSSEDLSRWQTLMHSATLLHTQVDGQSLQHARIPLPVQAYGFLRIEAGARGPLPMIESITVERVAASDPMPPTWIQAQALPSDPDDPTTAFVFSAGRRAPMRSADVRLPAANMALAVMLQSRDEPTQAWRTRWHGEVFALADGEAKRGQTIVQFDPVADRYWRLEVQRGAETLRAMSPSLFLGYRPARLRFLAQGEEPYQLAYGSARVSLERPHCDSLLASLSAEERKRMSGRTQTDGAPMRSNLEALEPLPEPTPLRQMLLWGVLIAGALLVAAMALSLLKKLQQE